MIAAIRKALQRRSMRAKAKDRLRNAQRIRATSRGGKSDQSNEMLARKEEMTAALLMERAET